MSPMRVFFFAFVAATLGSAFIAGIASADVLDCSGSKKSTERRSFEVIRPGDRPDRVLGQYIRVDVISSKNADIDGTEQTVYVHFDEVGGTGTATGYGDFALKNGERLWYKFEGTYYVIAGTSEIHYQGLFHFIGGTGKYRAIRGGAHYECTQISRQLTEEFVCSAVY